MHPTNYYDDLIPRDTAPDDSGFDTGTNMPLSEIEIQDLLYGSGRTLEERLQLLRSLRDDLAARGSADFGDDDPNDLGAELDARIAELEAETDNGGGVTFDADPLAHRETLAPDSDEIEALDKEEEASLDEEDEWLDAEDDAGTSGSGFDLDFDDDDLEDDITFADDDDDIEDDEDEGDVDNDDEVAH